LQELRKYAQEEGMSELFVPKKIIYQRKIPLLGSGKVDYVKLKEQLELS
jgi:acyl-[acyl-carrier-protein]-phospholipid O-acyltransferase/long-chain-fatty-acid--[acyl-carrier-protein] ligase